jgi:hypothetical protein
VSVTPLLPVVFQSVVQTNNTIQFGWSAQAGLVYQVQYDTSLDPTGWINLGSPLTATSSTVSVTDTPGSDPQRFYRLVVLP